MEQLTTLFVRSLQAPQDAARQIPTMGLSRDVLWTSLALVSAINTVLFTISLQIAPGQQLVLPILEQPLAFFVLVSGSLVVLVHGLHWTGRALGGQGDLGDLLALVIWLQAMGIVGRVAVLLLMGVSFGLAGLASITVGFLGVWLLVNFIAVAQRFRSLAPAFMTLVLGFLGVLAGAVVMGTLINLAVLGVPADV